MVKVKALRYVENGICILFSTVLNFSRVFIMKTSSSLKQIMREYCLDLQFFLRVLSCEGIYSLLSLTLLYIESKWQMDFSLPVLYYCCES